MNYPLANSPTPVAGGSIAICGACFDALGDSSIFLSVEATVQKTYTSCPDCLPSSDNPNGSLVINTAYLTLVDATYPPPSDCSSCAAGTTCTTDLSDNIQCLSQSACDTASQTAFSNPTCVVPEICVAPPQINCQEQYCFCKTATVVQETGAPTEIQYDITLQKFSPPAGCSFTPTFYFTACPGQSYTYTITIPNTPSPPAPFPITGSATPCPIGTLIGATEDGKGCEVCAAPIPSGCGVTGPAIPFSSVSGVTTLSLTITNSSGTVISTCITVPDQDSATPVCLGDCITYLCNSSSSDCGTSTSCVFTPTAPAVFVLNPVFSDNPCDNFHLLALLIGNTAATNFFTGFPPCPVIDSPASNLGIFNVSCVDGQPASTVQLSAEELDLVLEYGLNYQVILQPSCCDCLTVQNSFRLVSGDAQCGAGVPPTSCSPPVTVSDTTSSVYNTIQLPSCCRLPACTAAPTVTSVTPSGALLNVPTVYTIIGMNYDCTLAVTSPDGSAVINSYNIVSSTEVIVNATLITPNEIATSN